MNRREAVAALAASGAPLLPISPPSYRDEPNTVVTTFTDGAGRVRQLGVQLMGEPERDRQMLGYLHHATVHTVFGVPFDNVGRVRLP